MGSDGLCSTRTRELNDLCTTYRMPRSASSLTQPPTSSIAVRCHGRLDASSASTACRPQQRALSRNSPASPWRRRDDAQHASENDELCASSQGALHPFQRLTARLVLAQFRAGTLPEPVLVALLAGVGLRP